MLAGGEAGCAAQGPHSAYDGSRAQKKRLQAEPRWYGGTTFFRDPRAGGCDELLSAVGEAPVADIESMTARPTFLRGRRPQKRRLVLFILGSFECTRTTEVSFLSRL